MLVNAFHFFCNYSCHALHDRQCQGCRVQGYKGKVRLSEFHFRLSTGCGGKTDNAEEVHVMGQISTGIGTPIGEVQTAFFFVVRSWHRRFGSSLGLYGEIIAELKLGDYQPHRLTYHALSHLCHDIKCRGWVSVDYGSIHLKCTKV